MTQPLRLGTRASALALWQARRVADLIAAQPGAPPVELVHIRTEGDARTDVPLWAVGGRAFFTKEIDRALLAKDVDLAVHSLKDLSSSIEPGLMLAAVLEREEPVDALLSPHAATLAELPKGARVGTSSLRRRAFLARARKDLQLLELRGNVPTRIEKLTRGEYDAIVLATAGVKRLGLQEHIRSRLDPREFPPAVSQGAIGVCARADDDATLRWLAPLDHRATRIAVTAERALLRRIEGGCQVPLGALATVEEGTLHMHAAVCALDGSKSLSAAGDSAVPEDLEAAIAAARALGEKLGAELLAQGAVELIREQRAARSAEPP